MTVDLTRILTFADRDGHFCQKPARSLFTLIDGILGGQGEGSLEPDPCQAGMLLCGVNPVAVDIVATRIMGFNPLFVPTYVALLKDPFFDFGIHSLQDIAIVSQDDQYASCLSDTHSRFLAFAPHPGWVGHIEVEREKIDPILP